MKNGVHFLTIVLLFVSVVSCTLPSTRTLELGPYLHCDHCDGPQTFWMVDTQRVDSFPIKVVVQTEKAGVYELIDLTLFERKDKVIDQFTLALLKDSFELRALRQPIKDESGVEWLIGAEVLNPGGNAIYSQMQYQYKLLFTMPGGDSLVRRNRGFRWATELVDADDGIERYIYLSTTGLGKWNDGFGFSSQDRTFRFNAETGLESIFWSVGSQRFKYQLADSAQMQSVEQVWDQAYHPPSHQIF